MSGHSKWANIRVKKTAQDSQRGKVFTRHAKLIEIATREGCGGDPNTNARLKTALENAKADNVPNANIERAIKKGTGELKGECTESVTYAAYITGTIALLIECLTDNKNRTLSNVRSIVEKRGGKWAESGSVMFLFDRKGVVIGQGNISQEIELALIDIGADDIEISDDRIAVTTDVGDWPKVRDFFKERGIIITDAGLKYIAKRDIDIANKDEAKKILDMIDTLEEDDDVSQVHTNANIDDRVLLDS